MHVESNRESANDAKNSRRLPSHHGLADECCAGLGSMSRGSGVVGIFVQMLLQMHMCVWCLSCALVEGGEVASPCS